MRTHYDDVNGTVIGDVDTSKSARLVNTATGELVAETRNLANDTYAHLWAIGVIQDRRQLWGVDFDRHYPKGFDLLIAP